MIKMIIHFWGFILLCLALPAQASVTVAVITPKAGTYATEGQELTAGAQKAVNELNTSGGILKQKVKILNIDDQCNDSIAVSTAQMLSLLKSKNIAAVIGPFCDNNLQQISQIYANAGLMQIIPMTMKKNTQKIKPKGLIKMLGFTTQEATDFFNYYNTHLAGEIIALIYNEKSASGLEIIEAIKEQFQKHGKSAMLKSYTFQQANKDYEALAANVVADGLRTAFVIGTVTNIKKIARYLKSEWADFKIFTDKYAATEEYFKYLEEDAEGTYFMALNGQSNNPENAETMVQLRLGGLDTDGLALYGYTAIKIWAQIINKSNSFDYNKSSKKINGYQYQTPFGKLIFTDGIPKNTPHYAVYIYQNGIMQRTD